MNSDRKTPGRPAGLGHGLWMVLLIALSIPAAGETGPDRAAHHRLSQVRAAAPAIERAWLVSSNPQRRLPLSDNAAQQIGRIVADCRPGEDPAYTTPPWPQTVVGFAAADGNRYAFQLVATAIRVDARNPYAPSLESFTDDRLETTVRDCYIDIDAEDRLLHLHRRHLGPSETKEYRPAGGQDVPDLLKEQTRDHEY